MTTIYRGHNFGATDTVNPADLNDLVKNAVISGLSISDIPGSGLQISTLSAASGAGTGWISAQYDNFYAGVGTSIYSEFNYVLSSIHGDVSLFKPNGMESRRFWWQGGSNLGPGIHVQPNAGGGGVTLAASYIQSSGWAIPNCLGPNHATAVAGGRVRVILRGTGDVHQLNIPVAGSRNYFHYFNDSGTGMWNIPAAAGATNTNKVFGLTMRPDLTGGSTRVPGFFFGAPIWRS